METKHSYGCIPFRGEPGSREVLLIQARGNEVWGFPKGRKDDPGESDTEAALRELREETGITACTVMPGVSFTDEYDAAWEGKPYHKQVTFFLCESAGEETLVPEEKEILEARWCTFPEAHARMTYDATRRILARAAAHLNEPL